MILVSMAGRATKFEKSDNVHYGERFGATFKSRRLNPAHRKSVNSEAQIAALRRRNHYPF
jgi:hypothetical protein